MLKLVIEKRQATAARAESDEREKTKHLKVMVFVRIYRVIQSN